ncbi:uncharacterized protein YpuA [Paraliobacillus ryukyuensis]|uniref:Uncharacterized protein YpuA (DUF1002 family) n=1 Tax=Paraliobacillus ryukyuensis TaxID=200904 RepID=A0A366EDD7_9BACI|nr:DUF1002 domain-containing protein [Paraliobacillus ryukyuensis]RBP00421.1 uncharacterized protein YpuA (DUF1002 family) [Paraliobacillus ryukyuensis]
MKRIQLLVVAIIIAVLGFSSQVFASTGDNEGSINEKNGLPRVVYGDALSEAQKEQVRELLDVTDVNSITEYTVTGEDLANYIGGDPSSNMYSSAKITKKNDGFGLVINIVNDENITEVTKEMYANALLTAGVENAEVDVASPVKVSGHSALTGIYKAFNVDGESLNQDRMEVANEELEIATDLATEEGVDQQKVSELLTEIKQKIAEQDPVSKEEVEQIVQEQIDRLNINLSQEDIDALINLFDKMRNINIDFDNVTSQLEDIASDIKNKISDVTSDPGFWEGVKNFFVRLIDGLKNIFASE